MSYENLKWWVVLVVTVMCMLSIPGLLKMFWEALKEDFPNFFNDNDF